MRAITTLAEWLIYPRYTIAHGLRPSTRSIRVPPSAGLIIGKITLPQIPDQILDVYIDKTEGGESHLVVNMSFWPPKGAE
jgi:hypothetical protein